MRPNIFDYATSELSQDAFLLWLLRWADQTCSQEDTALHAIAQRFVRTILKKSNDFEISEVKVFKQWKKIDVLAVVNNHYAIIIEDKTDTSEHGGQLSRYSKIVCENFPNMNLTCVYYKSGNECMQSLREMRRKYKQNNDGNELFILTRGDMLELLTSEKCDNEILTSYLSYIDDIEQETNSFALKPVDEWGWRAWQGFYKTIEKWFDIDLNLGWNTISRKSGGFQGCYFNFCSINNEKAKLYILIEGTPKSLKDTKICFKICHISEQPIAACRKWSQNVISTAKGSGLLNIKKLSKFRKGEYMTVAGIEGKDFFGTGIVDLKNIETLLRQYVYLINKITMKTVEIFESPFEAKSISKDALYEFMLAFFRESNMYYNIKFLTEDANIHQNQDGFWVAEVNRIWDTDRTQRMYDWEQAMRKTSSIYVDGEQILIKYKRLI